MIATNVSTTNDNKNKKRKTSITQFTPTTFDQNTSEFKKIKIPSEDITKDSLPNRDALNLTYDGTKINNKKRKSETESEDSTHSTLKDAGVEKEENNKKRKRQEEDPKKEQSKTAEKIQESKTNKNKTTKKRKNKRRDVNYKPDVDEKWFNLKTLAKHSLTKEELVYILKKRENENTLF